MIYSYDRRSKSKSDPEALLQEYGLEGLTNGTPVTLYHGTTKTFRTFDLNQSRDDLVNKYYGKGIFLSPSKRIAELYAEANRNIGFNPSIIDDLKRKNPGAGDFLSRLVAVGADAWEQALKDLGFWNDGPTATTVGHDMDGFKKYLGGVDSNTLSDIADYIIGSTSKPLRDETGNPFFQSTGTPSYIYDQLDEVGLNSKIYRPKVYTVTTTVQNTLVTKSKSLASKARSKGYEAVFYYGTDLVRGEPEVAVFSPRNVKVRKIEIL